LHPIRLLRHDCGDVVNAARIFRKTADAIFPSSAQSVAPASAFFGGRPRRLGSKAGDGGFGAGMLGQQLGVLSEPIARAFGLHDSGVVQGSVQERGRDHGIAEQRRPIIASRP
jgi:hypothetical protein